MPCSLSRLTNKSQKSDILFNLATSGGLSGVRKKSEVFKNNLADIDQYEQLILLQNKAMMDTKVDKTAQKLIWDVYMELMLYGKYVIWN